MIRIKIQQFILVVIVVTFVSLYKASYVEARPNNFIDDKKNSPYTSGGTNASYNYLLTRSSIVSQPDVYLDINPGKYLKPNGDFVFEVPKAADQIYRFGKIMGTTKDDNVIFDGKLIVGILDLLDGKNTLNFKEYSEITLDPNMTPSSSLNFYNIATFNIAEGVKMEKLNAIYGSYDMTFNFNSTDSSNQDKDINITQISLIGGDNIKGFININNAKVNITGNANLSTKDEVITLKDAKFNSDGSVDKKTISILSLSKGLSIAGGNNTITMGKFSKIIAAGQSLQMYGNNTLNLDAGSMVQGSLLFKDGNNSINVISIGKENYKNDLYKITIDSIVLGSGQNNINIKEYSNFNVNSSVTTGNGTTRIFVGNNSVFKVNGEVTFFGKFNHVQLGEGSETTSSFKFSSVSSNNNFVVDTGNSQTTLKGNVMGSKNNDTFSLLGTGVLMIESPTHGQGLDGFSNINLGQARIDFKNNVSQTNSTNISISLLESDTQEKDPRIAFNELARFNNNSISLKYRGVTKNLGQVGSNYQLTLFTIGKPGEGQFSKLSDIDLNSINFQSAIYKLDYNIINDGLNLNLTKCSTFKDAVSGKDLCNMGNKEESEEYVIQIANFLDQLVDIKDLPQKYYDMLDDFAMMSVAELNKTLSGFAPINNTVLFNINKNLADNFKEVTLNSKPYKITKNDIALWSNYNYSKINLDNIKGAKGALANGNVFMIGGEYSLFSFLKLGADIGYSKPNITGNDNFFKGNSNNIYYEVYGNSNITNNLTLKVNIGFLNSTYDLTRDINVNGGETIKVDPKFRQNDIDVLLSYKIKLGLFMVAPFASAGYSKSTMDSYNESGFMSYKIDKSTFSVTKAELGVKALAVGALGSAAVIPSITLAVNASSQNSEGTKAHLVEFSDIALPIIFNADNYGGVTGKGSFGISYLLNNGITINFNIGANVSSKVKAYNLGAAVNLTL